MDLLRLTEALEAELRRVRGELAKQCYPNITNNSTFWADESRWVNDLFVEAATLPP